MGLPLETAGGHATTNARRPPVPRSGRPWPSDERTGSGRGPFTEFDVHFVCPAVRSPGGAHCAVQGSEVGDRSAPSRDAHLGTPDEPIGGSSTEGHMIAALPVPSMSIFESRSRSGPAASTSGCPAASSSAVVPGEPSETSAPSESSALCESSESSEPDEPGDRASRAPRANRSHPGSRVHRACWSHQACWSHGACWLHGRTGGTGGPGVGDIESLGVDGERGSPVGGVRPARDPPIRCSCPDSRKIGSALRDSHSVPSSPVSGACRGRPGAGSSKILAGTCKASRGPPVRKGERHPAHDLPERTVPHAFHVFPPTAARSGGDSRIGPGNGSRGFCVRLSERRLARRWPSRRRFPRRGRLLRWLLRRQFLQWLLRRWIVVRRLVRRFLQWWFVRWRLVQRRVFQRWFLQPLLGRCDEYCHDDSRL